MMKFINVQAYEREDSEGVFQGLEVLYDDKEGRHEIKAEGNTNKECLLNLLDMVAKIAQNQD